MAEQTFEKKGTLLTNKHLSVALKKNFIKTYNMSGLSYSMDVRPGR